MRPVSITRFRAEIDTLYSPPRRAKATRKQIAQVLREFAELPGVKRTSDLNPATIARWMDAHPGRTVVRTKSLLATFRAACKYAVSQNYISSNPFDFWKPNEWIRDDAEDRPRSSRPVRHKSAADLGRVLDQADREAVRGWEQRRLQALVYTYAFTGMRAGEAMHLYVSEIDLNARVLQIAAKPGWRPKTLKSAKPIPIAPPLAEVLSNWLPHTGSTWAFPTRKLDRPWTTGGPGYRPLDAVKELGRRAGVEGLTILGFRKSIGTLAKAMGISQLERKDLLRHTSVETGDYYDEDDLDLLKATIAKIHYPRHQAG